MIGSAGTGAETARGWALRLTRRPSVTGTPDEASFAAWLADELRDCAAFAGARIWTEAVAPGDGRSCVFMLLRGRGAATAILTGHFDTVSTADYGPLRPLATEPEALARALSDRLAGGAATPAEARARDDLATGDWLPGRGLLDMKAGLAAGLAAAAAWAAGPRVGNLLFLAVPDEEARSAGARHAAASLPALAAREGLDLRAAVNLDAIADDTDGAAGRAVALGTVGKLLPTVFVAGLPTHAGFPLAGLNAAGLIAAIAARLEWAPELVDLQPDDAGTPPSVMFLRDGKDGYDVTTPAGAFACVNVLTRRTGADAVAGAVDRLCAEAAEAHLAALAARVPDGADLPLSIPVLRFAYVRDAALRRDPEAVVALDEALARHAQAETSMPRLCEAATAAIWAASGLPGPAIVTGFGSVPYLPTSLSATGPGARLARICRAVAEKAEARHGESVRCIGFFPGICDMSFIGEADAGALDGLRHDTPAWEAAVGGVPDRFAAGIPTVNVGPWGRDYHTPLERLHCPYAFDTLPELLGEIVEAVLGDDHVRGTA